MFQPFWGLLPYKLLYKCQLYTISNHILPYSDPIVLFYFNVHSFHKAFGSSW